MIESVQFKNFKALRDTTLPLGRFTLIVGRNGSGKSTALDALRAVHNPSQKEYQDIATAGLESGENAKVQVRVNWGRPFEGVASFSTWSPKKPVVGPSHHSPQRSLKQEEQQYLNNVLAGVGIFSLDAQAIIAPSELLPNPLLAWNGANIATVLDKLMTQEPERFDSLNEELTRWLPEFDRILLDTPQQGHRGILLRTREGQHKIRAKDISQGMLFALSLLTLAYSPTPTPVICLEEPDRGIHPRLLRNVQDALYRLSYPESAGEKRESVQVIATTQSPYLLDLYSDHPEDVVISSKDEQGVRFERLSDMPHLDEILRDSRLGDIWYTGILGGVPSHI